MWLWTPSRWHMVLRNHWIRRHRRSRICRRNKSATTPSPRAASSTSGAPSSSTKAKYTNVRKRNNNCSIAKVKAATTKVLRASKTRRLKLRCSREPNSCKRANSSIGVWRHVMRRTAWCLKTRSLRKDSTAKRPN